MCSRDMKEKYGWYTEMSGTAHKTVNVRSRGGQGPEQ